MKTYIVNLKAHTQKKDNILRQCAAASQNDAEIFEAVYGAALSEGELAACVDDAQNCGLSKGEIGCSLSHMGIYQKIISQNLPRALVLEDDVILRPFLPDILKDIEQFDNPDIPAVYLLSRVTSYLPFTGHKLKHCALYEVYYAAGTSSYVINRAAAQKMREGLYPVSFIADDWDWFRFILGFKIYCPLPLPAADSDPDKINSVIEKEREKRDAKKLAARGIKRKFKYPLAALKRAFHKNITIFFSRRVEKDI
ncbi:MAG: glycosyltransferase family 25 protein [Elusimicrobiota bacterium]|jgi:glycosyl transferase family 25|nr:glycosyltransferase family 25 protein [Elusimicrobiota bacterium]